VYRKPKAFDESSSDTDDECEHCQGHVEIKKSQHPKNGDTEPTPGGSGELFSKLRGNIRQKSLLSGLRYLLLA